MARIRTIKPDSWLDRRLGEVSRDARLLWVVLITMADDEGRFRAHPGTVWGHGYTHDAQAMGLIPRWLDELRDARLIDLYESAGEAFGWLPKWSDHQRISKPTSSRLPVPPELPRESQGIPDGGGGPPRDSQPRAHAGAHAPEVEVEEEVDREVEEEQEAARAGDVGLDDPPVVAAPPVLPRDVETACDNLAAAGLHVHDRTTVSRLAAQHPAVDIVEASIRCAAWARGRRIKHPFAALRTIVEGDDAPRRGTPSTGRSGSSLDHYRDMAAQFAAEEATA